MRHPSTNFGLNTANLTVTGDRRVAVDATDAGARVGADGAICRPPTAVDRHEYASPHSSVDLSDSVLGLPFASSRRETCVDADGSPERRRAAKPCPGVVHNQVVDDHREDGSSSEL
jgi:hypothetical protein